MKRKTMHVFRSYRYTECDDLAAWLSEMAEKGWEFVSWKTSFTFRRAEPGKAVYAAYVFSGASEDDTRPEPETEEFSDYCEAAGWKLVCAKKKWCIFKRERDDAVPIETQEEKLANVSRAEGKQRITDAIYWTVCTAGYLFQWWYLFFPESAFMGTYLLLSAYWTIMDVYYIVSLFRFFFWKHRAGRQLEEEGEVFYGGKRHRSSGAFWLRTGILPLLITSTLAADGLSSVIPVICAGMAAVYLFAWFLQSAGLSREENRALSFLVPLCVIAAGGVLAGVSASDEGGAVPSSVSALTSCFPEESSGKAGEDYAHTVSILGTYTMYDLDYESGKRLYFEVLESDSKALLDAGYERLLERRISSWNGLEQDPKDWGALKAAYVPALHFYLVRYEDKIFYLQAPEAVSGETAENIKNVLDLY